MSFIWGFILYMLIVGLVGREIYWTLAGLLQMAIGLPVIKLLVGKELKGGKEISEKKNKLLIFIGAPTTFILTAVWTILVGYDILLAIVQTNSFGWQKWIFIIAGFFLAIYLPSAENKEDSEGAQNCIAIPTVIIVYIINVIVILLVELPKFIR
jgi:hypothetical protein